MSPPIWTQIHVASVTWIFCCNKAPSFKIKEGASFPAALRVAFLWFYNLFWGAKVTVQMRV
ncbi:hypothetical protein DW817_10005, partial [Acidaminococcus sp. AM33-14BH]|uniref:hypothetical protein n=1 Tax=Acidaminococcus sp. AM33-14BH TaxID=2292909 RepID=UPI000ED852F4